MTMTRVIAATLLLTATARADDWPQWLGPQRDAMWREPGIVERLPPDGPKVLWRAPVSNGYSGPAVAGGRVYLTDYVIEGGDATPSYAKRSELKGRERVLCFDQKTGTQVWNREDDCPYGISFPNGPRTTPAVSDGRVYTLGAEGHLLCLNAASGELVWDKEFKKEYGIEAPMWGFCGHPLVDGDTLYCVAGGEGSVAVAFDKATGKERWRALTAKEPGYAPPSLIDVGGQKQLVVWHAEAVAGLDPATGKPLWTVPLAPAYGMSIAAPRVAPGGRLFASGMFNKAALIQPGPTSATVVRKGERDTDVYSKNTTPLVVGGTYYGIDLDGALRAVDVATGKRLWSNYAATGGKPAESGTAFLVGQGDRVWLFTERGELVLAKLSPEKYDELGRAKLVEPTHATTGRTVVWSHPAFAGGCVFARNDKELVCASLRVD